MNQIKATVRVTLCIIASIATSHFVTAGLDAKLVDDFSDAQNNSLGYPRQFVDDTASGGQTKVEQSVDNGVFSLKGDLIPARGQPGWASAVLLLDPQGAPVDASLYEGIALRVRINKGTLSVSANSSEVTNFDYHAAVIARQTDGEFHEVKVPFASMKRTWSEQTPLNAKTLSSISLVSFGLQRGPFHFEVDEVRFY